MTDRDPCFDCPHLIVRPLYAPHCARATNYGETGCVRLARRGTQSPGVGTMAPATPPRGRRG